MRTSDKYLGKTKEVVGGENPTILKFSKEAGDPQSEDEIAWCSYYENAIMFETPGCEGFMTHNGLALSWTHAPNCEEIDEDDLRFGDIVIFNWGNGHGHVTNFVRWVDDDKESFVAQGGNQHDSVDQSN